MISAKSQLSPAFAAAIRKEYQALRGDESVMHNREMHRRILETWRLHSPKMWQSLQQINLAVPLAFVLQQRMWQESKRLREAGMPAPDAREQAERNHLMLEPEAQEETLAQA